MALDFSLLGQGPQFGNILASYDQGREARKEHDVKGALALYDTDPEQGLSAMMKVDPVTGMKLREDYTAKRTAAAKQSVFQEADPEKRLAAATETGDPATIEAVMKLDKGVREQKKEATDALGGFAFGLRTKVPYDQRKALIQQNIAGLQAAGFTPEQIASFDPTDANLDGVVSQMQTLDQAFKFADQQADNERAKAEADERARHNLEMEGVAGRNAASSAARAGAAVTNANRPRPNSGGALAASRPTRTYSASEVKFD